MAREHASDGKSRMADGNLDQAARMRIVSLVETELMRTRAAAIQFLLSLMGAPIGVTLNLPAKWTVP